MDRGGNANRGRYHRGRGGGDGNRGNRGGGDGHRGNRGGGGAGNHGNGEGNRGGNHNWRRGNRGEGGNRGWHRGNRGGNNENRGGHNENRGGLAVFRGGRLRETVSRPNTPNQMDWFDMRLRAQSQSMEQLNIQPNHPMREEYGGRYGREQQEQQPNRGGASGRRDRGPRGNSQRSFMGFQRLEEMSKMDPDQLVVVLLNKESGLEKLLNTDLSPDYIVLILRVIEKLCETPFPQNKARVLASVCQKEFMDKLLLFLSNLPLQEPFEKQRNKYFWTEQDRFWNSLLLFFSQILLLLPNTASEVLPKMVKLTCMTITNIEIQQSVTVPDTVKKTLEDLQLKVMMCVEEREKKKIAKASDLDDREPPDNFRNISLYPTVNEITTHEQSFLRANIVDGGYRSVDHYLDVQFRLLREDFVAPLRKGICDYIAQQGSRERKKIFNVKFYKNVRFIKKHTIQDKVSVVVQFTNVVQKKKNLENTKRFMFGSLVCFTNDNFRSVIFGTVADRHVDLLKKGQIAVDTLDNIFYDRDYTMVECSVYFEPYYHVLRALKVMDEEKFPLKRYIIDVEPEVYPPSYFTDLCRIEYNGFRFYPLIENTWPSARELGLDPSQFKAFQSALSKEFCVIQGPPGTGKTYIGLKVAEVLIENKVYWNVNRGPILVICFTNHALDQFLEGICKYTKKLIRIGGQSKSEALKNFNIREMRSKFHRERASNELMFKKRDEIRQCMTNIQNHQYLLDAILSLKHVISFDHFGAIDERFKNSWFDNASDSELIEWLMGGRTPEARYQERQRLRAAQVQAQLQENKDESDSDEEFFDAEVQEQREVDDRDEIIVKVDKLLGFNKFLVSLETYEERLRVATAQFAALEVKAEETNNFVVWDERGAKEEEMMKAKDDLDYFTWRMEQFQTGNIPRLPVNMDYKNPSHLTPNERWGLYFHWLGRLRHQLNEDLSVLDGNYRRLYGQYEEVKQIEDIRLMREMLVVGMTTTGAARYQTLLQALKCPIVIVEEAAEVLESHVVVSLTNDCKHLILIGDHQQLRPTISEYHLAKKFNLEISLFERMVKNKIHCEQLEVQHRMRPEIARLIVPSIYPKLDNHVSVESYPPVLGVTKSLFFITHSEPEEAVDDTGSRRNVHEAKFLIRLARHFILQGYEPQDITILATYSGQMFCLWKERKPYAILKDVRITVVDNFQGEESKIILLSLVRSNKDANIGFLRTDNRVCVALSRAKEGMYIMGNMEILKQSDNVWPKIRTVLEELGSLDTHLTLRCQVHTDQETRVATADDFRSVIEGGCSLLCGKQLDCGHTCASLCHITDREHTKYKCKEKCNMVLCELGHGCPDLCFIECKPCMVLFEVILKCGHKHKLPCHMNDTSDYKCNTLVEVELECGHKAMKPCHRDIKKFPCPHICEVRKQCGHACERKCHIHDDPDHLLTRCFKPCGQYRKNCSLQEHLCPLQCYQECVPCEILVKKLRVACGHMFDVPCSQNVDEMECSKRCKKKLPCGHNCRMGCKEPCGNCLIKVEKTVESCGHTVKVECRTTPDRWTCKGKCPRTLPCGHPCNKRCNEECTTKCETLVDNPHKAACGHMFQIPCYKVNKALSPTSYSLLRHCSIGCGVELECGHLCAGTCGECVQGRMHATCREQCGATLVCGHACDTPCREACQPCNKSCSYRCPHSKCGRKCGEPCTSCTEPCKRRCEHQRCDKLCGQPCSCEPCEEPCLKRLRCGHPCIGFCGDPCPPVCRVCTPEDDTFTVLFGSEDEPDARFVWLEECKHTIESDAMDQWLQQTSGGEINVKHCPKCKTTITLTQRYSKYIKEAYKDIIMVKRKWFGQEAENEANRVQLQIRVTNVSRINVNLYLKSKYLRVLLQNLQKTLQETRKGKRNPLNIVLFKTCMAQVQLIERMVNIFNKAALESNEQLYSSVMSRLDYLLFFIKNQKNRITGQEIKDLELEIDRFEKFVQLCTIEKNLYFSAVIKQERAKELYEGITKDINSTSRYTELTDAKLKDSIEKLRIMVDKSMIITNEEKQMIVQAMGLGKGRWFKCPNGHPYAIGECGGAMETSVCPECKTAIGGTNHALLATNQFAGDMDGAAHPAWSDQANMNMANFIFDD